MPSKTATAAIIAALSAAASATAITGESTFYGGNLNGGACSFSTYTLPSGLYGTAYSGQTWSAAAHCGQCVEVTGPSGNSITAMVSLMTPLPTVLRSPTDHTDR